jgi:O-antigen ligase
MRRQITLWLVLAGLAVLAMGALQARQDWLIRGIPQDLPEPIVGGGLQFGLNVALEHYNEAELLDNLAQIQALGVQHVKQSFYFNEAFDWAATDRLIAAINAQDLTLVPLLDGQPADDFAVVDTAVFAQWAGQFAARYGHHIQHYIVWDEPNITSHWGGQPVNPNEYAALLTAAAAAIRTADSDALIVAAPLAPTVETGPMNLSETIYLRALYEAGAANAFDIAAAKPYGFDHSPDDRDVSANKLNFSRVILLREEMVRNGDSHKAIWAGNWGWNSLPDGWIGEPSIWGRVTQQQQKEWTAAAYRRAQHEWPWMGLMFLENWQPDAPTNDPRWGFAIAGRETADSLPTPLASTTPDMALPGFHLAQPDGPAQVYTGGWRFSPEFGADISQPPEGGPNDQVTFTFWGTDVGLRVRRADFRARLYVTVDGRPANALPRDENGTMLILTSPDADDDFITTEVIARNLLPGEHIVHIEAARGWDQWALHGFTVGYRPPDAAYRRTMMGLGIIAVFSFIMAMRITQRAAWGSWALAMRHRFLRLSEGAQVGLTAVVAALVALAGWFTWGEQAAGLYRRLGDGGQLAITAVAATIFYITPSFFVYAVALVILFLLIYFRPVWGLALIAFSFPLYIPTVTKAIFHLNFSAVELFTLVTLAAFILHKATMLRNQVPLRNLVPRLKRTDFAVLTFVGVATLSLFFTARLDVASNEWRVVILEPAIFYFLFRAIRPSQKEVWTIWDAFVLGGLLVAGYGLWQYAFARDTLITAEGGLLRLRSFYGSPNNVALYLGRVLPVVMAVPLFGETLSPTRCRAYILALIPIALAFLLTFSKGGLFLGVPAAFLFIFWRWQQQAGRRTWPWLIVFGVSGIIGLVGAQQIPQLAGRLALTGATGVFRINLWAASLNMFVDHPWLGIGLDNFLYAYRSRYIFDAAWEEPNLNHPHNILLDFATRLGIFGLLAGGWLFWEYGRRLKRLLSTATADYLPLAIGLGGLLANIIVHGLVDHSFFLVDLAFAFYFGLATAVWLTEQKAGN